VRHFNSSLISQIGQAFVLQIAEYTDNTISNDKYSADYLNCEMDYANIV